MKEQFGTLQIEERLHSVPQLDRFDTAATLFKGTGLLQLIFEIGFENKQDLLPPALHPTSPPIAVFQHFDVPESEWGPFKMLLTRIVCRAGVRLRGFVSGCLVDNPSAATALSQRWGFPCQPAHSRTAVYYDSIPVTLTDAGGTLFEGCLVDPEPISGADIFYTANTHLVRTPRGARLVQVDSEFTFHKADRGRPRVDQYDSLRLFGKPGVRLNWPVSASFCRVDVTLAEIRYVSDPNIPAIRGTQTVADELASPPASAV